MERAKGDKARGTGAVARIARLLGGLEVEVGGSTEVVYIYLDGRSLVALYDLEGVHHDDAVGVFRAIGGSKCRMVTPLLAVMEAVAAVRKKARSYWCRSEDAEGLAGVEAHVQGAAGGMAKFVANMSKENLLVVMDSEGLSSDLELLYGKVLEYSGRVVPAPEGGECRHRAVGSCDRVDFWLARAFDAAAICTTDGALADNSGRDEEFGEIAVQLASAPLAGSLA